MERKSVDGVHDDGYTGEAGGKPPDEAALGSMGMHDCIPLTPQELAQTEEAREIPERTDLTPDDVQVDDPEGLPLESLLNAGVSGQNIDLPAFCPRHPAQPIDNRDYSPEARITDYVQDPH